MRYTRLSANSKGTKQTWDGPRRRCCSKGGPIGAAKVSDEGVREQRLAKTLPAMENRPTVQPSKERFSTLPGAGFRKSGYPHWSSGKHSALVVQMGNLHEHGAAVRGL